MQKATATNLAERTWERKDRSNNTAPNDADKQRLGYAKSGKINAERNDSGAMRRLKQRTGGERALSKE